MTVPNFTIYIIYHDCQINFGQTILGLTDKVEDTKTQYFIVFACKPWRYFNTTGSYWYTFSILPWELQGNGMCTDGYRKETIPGPGGAVACVVFLYATVLFFLHVLQGHVEFGRRPLFVRKLHQ